MEEMEEHQIRVWNSPEVVALPDNRWEKTWCIGLEEILTSPHAFDKIAEELSREIRSLIKELFDYRHPGKDYPVEQDDFVLRFDLITEKELNVVIDTGRYTRTDEFWVFAPVWLFMRIEQQIGHIISIQNEPKEQHFFWRGRKIFWGNRCPV